MKPNPSNENVARGVKKDSGHMIKEPGISSPGSVAGASDKSSSAKRHSILS